VASTVEIYNLALTKIGASRITDPGDEAKGAQSISAVYDITRKNELANHPWTFAMTRAQLPALGAAPTFGWLAAYQLPADFLRMVEVGEYYVLYQQDIKLFEIEGRNILCDEASPLKIRYVADIENPGLFSAPFVEAFACKLAAVVAEDITQSPTKREAAEQAYERAIRAARRSNAIQLPPQPTPEDTWTLARRGVRG
jgi:hypothetical protein